MCDLTALYNEIKAKDNINILGNNYKISNCIIAVDDNILKLNIQLLAGTSALTLFTEIKNI